MFMGVDGDIKAWGSQTIFFLLCYVWFGKFKENKI